MSRKPRFAFLFVFLLALGTMLAVGPTYSPDTRVYAQSPPPIFDQGGDVPPLQDESADNPPPNTALGCVSMVRRNPRTGEFETVLICTFGLNTTPPPARNPIATKFFPASFDPSADISGDPLRRFGAVLYRGTNTVDGTVQLVKVSVNPASPGIVKKVVRFALSASEGENNFARGVAEAVLAVSSLDPTGNNNGSLAVAVTDPIARQELDPADPNFVSGVGVIFIVWNVWGDSSGTFQVGLTGPVSVTIDDVAQEVVVVEKTDSAGTYCPAGKSPVRSFRLFDGEEIDFLCIDGVGDSADIEIDTGNGVRIRKAFIARDFSKGGVQTIDLASFTEAGVFSSLYPAGAANPAPGLELDITAGLGYLAAPQLSDGLNTSGVRAFSLSDGTPGSFFPADVYYYVNNNLKTGLQEVSVSNHPNPPNVVRRGLVISRSDPVGFPNRADRVTGIDLNTGLKNLIGTDKQTTSIAIVPPKPSDDPNQLFLFRIKVDYATNTSKIGVKQLVLQ